MLSFYFESKVQLQFGQTLDSLDPVTVHVSSLPNAQWQTKPQQIRRYQIPPTPTCLVHVLLSLPLQLCAYVVKTQDQ